MKIVVDVKDVGEFESLPTEVADVDRVHTAQQIAREMHCGNPVTLLTAAGSVIISAELMKRSIVHVYW